MSRPNRCPEPAWMLDPPEAFEQYDPELQQLKREEEAERSLDRLADILS